MKNTLYQVRKVYEEEGLSFLEEVRDEAKQLKPGRTGAMEGSGYYSELQYKRVKSRTAQPMYHFHICSESLERFEQDMAKLEVLLSERNLHLDRMGVSIDYAMALPKVLRQGSRKGGALFFETQEDWNKLAGPKSIQLHLGDHMIGSPASYENAKAALKAGITTMGNFSQFFGWDYPEFTDVEARTKETLKAIALMAEKHEEAGTLLHSNLDDGYGAAADDLGILIGFALLEKYIAEDLLGAKIAHSYGDMFFSPMKRLVFLSALKMVHGDQIAGSMIFTNKLGRNKSDEKLNTAHLAECLLFDMTGQYLFKTGHAVTVMADCGLVPGVAPEEIVTLLGYAHELEAYVPQTAELMDLEKIEGLASEIVERGKWFFEAVISYLDGFIDIENPYAVTLALKRIGIRKLAEMFKSRDVRGVIGADYGLYIH